MKKAPKIALLVMLCVSVLLTTVSCAWINETVLGKEHEHRFKNPTVTKAPTCTEEGRQTALCKCGAVEVTTIAATGEHSYQNKVCTVCGRKDPTGLTAPVLCGDALSSYVIVYEAGALSYTVRAAEYIANEIKARTGITLSVLSINANSAQNPHEIVVGETSRPISQALDAATEGLEFSLLANDDHIAIEGDYFIIAAAAYYFVETYIPEAVFDIDVPQTVSVCTPIVKETKNVALLIGDGMGYAQTEIFDADLEGATADYSDGENFFYGYLLPYIGEVRTDSLSGTTDSAAGGTALASGFKTKNGYVGRDGDKNDVPLLTEIAAQLGKATAVLSTEAKTGATPSAFTSHVFDRSNTGFITTQQQLLSENFGTIINCGYDVYTESEMHRVRGAITETLEALSADEDGFFVMYEEAHIDKHCHDNDAKETYMAVLRFNQAIALFMEYAFYNPETMVIITADHETGGLEITSEGEWTYNSDDHTSANVPLFAYGAYADVFEGKTIENVQIPKTIAALFGVKIEGTNPEAYPALLPIMVINKK